MTETPSPARASNTYSVVWELPSRRFGWTDIEDCATSEEAADFFFREVRGKELPDEVQITAVRLVGATAANS